MIHAEILAKSCLSDFFVLRDDMMALFGIDILL